jgi:hypothetical protein
LSRALRHLPEAAPFFSDGKGAAIDQDRPYRQLQIANAPAEGRLCNVPHRGRFGEVKRRAERKKIVDPGKLHMSRSVSEGKRAG